MLCSWSSKRANFRSNHFALIEQGIRLPSLSAHRKVYRAFICNLNLALVGQVSQILKHFSSLPVVDRFAAPLGPAFHAIT